MKRSSRLLMIPTYNESGNVERLIGRVNALGLSLDILFVDDNSPDGTGHLLEQMATKLPNLQVLHRPGKLGIGGAHMAGIRRAYELGYETLVTMDSDFTHSPEDIPRFLAAGETHDVVVGSRYHLENSLEDWGFFRRCLTTFGHFVTKYLLGLPYDATGAFRVYNLRVIPQEAFELVRPRGYAFFFESLFLLNFNKYSIAEVPILMPMRTHGSSKMTLHEVVRSMRQLVSVLAAKVFDRKRFTIPTAVKLKTGAASSTGSLNGPLEGVRSRT